MPLTQDAAERLPIPAAGNWIRRDEDEAYNRGFFRLAPDLFLLEKCQNCQSGVKRKIGTVGRCQVCGAVAAPPHHG